MQSETTALFLLFGILRIYRRVTLNALHLCSVICFATKLQYLTFYTEANWKIKVFPVKMSF